MSTEKMNAYKEQKKHRKEIIAKERAQKKMQKVIATCVGGLCAAALVVALGLTGYNTWKASQPEVKDYAVTSQVVQDYTGVTLDEVEAEAE